MRPRIRARLPRPWGREHAGAQEPPEDQYIEIDTAELSGLFAAPAWLRDLGVAAWLLVGVAAFLAGAVWLLALTQTIAIPVIVAAIIASVVSPVVDWLERRGLPRAAGVVLVFLTLVALGAGIAVLTVSGVVNESQAIGSQLRGAADEIAGWLKDIGIDPSTADDAKDDVSASVSSGFHALLSGIAAGISELAGLAVFLSFTVLSLFFLLKDAPVIAAFVQRHMGVPQPVAKTITTRTAGSLQGYFLGMTIVSLFSATIVGLGALALGVSLPGTIFAVTFLGGYVPYLGAWTAGAFAVLIALGSSGVDAAAAMAVIALLANGALQQLVQPVAYGTALGIHPLAVLIVTIAAGSMFGTIGLILAAPLTSAAVRISTDLARARAEQDGDAPQATSEPGPEPGPPAPA
jgi:predicted PurR-regulated permease PerM